jgi:uncharacterized membrane protein (DUF2068 family)
MPETNAPHKVPRRWPVVLIGIGKLMKSTGLVVVFLVLRVLLSPERHQAIEAWVTQVRLEPHNWIMHHLFDLMERGMGLQPKTLQMLHLGVIIYAALYLIEGLGLLWDKKWAEWMVIVTTAGFLPFEVYEIVMEVTWGRCLLFAVNIVVMVYLCWRLYRMKVVRREREARGFPVVT